MNEDDEEEPELPKFECRLPIPDEFTVGQRMLLQQVDILRQTIEWVHKRGAIGRRAWILAKKNQADIEKFNRIYWGVLGVIAAVEFYLKLVK